jgi:hypothetical protein
MGMMASITRGVHFASLSSAVTKPNSPQPHSQATRLFARLCCSSGVIQQGPTRHPLNHTGDPTRSIPACADSRVSAARVRHILAMAIDHFTTRGPTFRRVL